MSVRRWAETHYPCTLCEETYDPECGECGGTRTTFPKERIAELDNVVAAAREAERRAVFQSVECLTFGRKEHPIVTVLSHMELPRLRIYPQVVTSLSSHDEEVRLTHDDGLKKTCAQFSVSPYVLEAYPRERVADILVRQTQGALWDLVREVTRVR